MKKKKKRVFDLKHSGRTLTVCSLNLFHTSKNPFKGISYHLKCSEMIGGIFCVLPDFLEPSSQQTFMHSTVQKFLWIRSSVWCNRRTHFVIKLRHINNDSLLSIKSLWEYLSCITGDDIRSEQNSTKLYPVVLILPSETALTGLSLIKFSPMQVHAHKRHFLTFSKMSVLLKDVLFVLISKRMWPCIWILSSVITVLLCKFMY